MQTQGLLLAIDATAPHLFRQTRAAMTTVQVSELIEDRAKDLNRYCF